MFIKKFANHAMVDNFADNWPCAGLRGFTVLAEFSFAGKGGHGDLVDLRLWQNGVSVELDDFNGDQYALACLSDDLRNKISNADFERVEKREAKRRQGELVTKPRRQKR